MRCCPPPPPARRCSEEAVYLPQHESPRGVLSSAALPEGPFISKLRSHTDSQNFSPSVWKGMLSGFCFSHTPLTALPKCPIRLHRAPPATCRLCWEQQTGFLAHPLLGGLMSPPNSSQSSHSPNKCPRAPTGGDSGSLFWKQEQSCATVLPTYTPGSHKYLVVPGFLSL